MELPGCARIGTLHAMKPGRQLFPNDHVDYSGARFNPCLGTPSRFATQHDPDRDCIPTVYAPTTLDAAACEIAFCDLFGSFASFARQKLQSRGVSEISPKKDLQLVHLFTPELISLGMSRQDLFLAQATDS